MVKCQNRKFVYIGQLWPLQHDCWHVITSPFLHRHSAKWSTCTRRKIHHYCDFYLPWNFEKQMVPCKTVMQLAMKQRTDSSGTGKLNHNSYSINGHTTPAHAATLLWTLLQLGLGPMSRNFYTMPEDPRPRPRLKGDGLKYAMLFSV